MNFLQWLDKVDKQVFTFIHYSLGNGFLDPIMLFFRNGIVWAPLYIFMAYWITRYHKKQAFKFILLSAVTVGITDFVSASILKKFFERPRPCYSEALQPILRHIIDCGGYNSFPSSHASNHFGMAAFWFWAIYILHGKKWNWLWVWAAIICFAQVYVGKHYPLDVIAGTLLGWLTGITAAKIFERWIMPGGVKSIPRSFSATGPVH